MRKYYLYLETLLDEELVRSGHQYMSLKLHFPGKYLFSS